MSGINSHKVDPRKTTQAEPQSSGKSGWLELKLHGSPRCYQTLTHERQATESFFVIQMPKNSPPDPIRGTSEPPEPIQSNTRGGHISASRARRHSSSRDVTTGAV